MTRPGMPFLVSLVVVLAAAGCGGSDSDSAGSPDRSSAAVSDSPTGPASTAADTPASDANVVFAQKSRTRILAGLRQVSKSTSLYMSDVNAGDFSAASISAALVAGRYADMRDRLQNIPEAGSTLGTDTFRAFTMCEDQWTRAARALPGNLPKATAAMRVCNAAVRDLTASKSQLAPGS